MRTVGSRPIVALTQSPLRGRAEIIQELSDLLSGVRRAGGGVTVLIGASGVGLSRLLVEAQGLAASRGIRVAHGFPAGPDVDSNLIDPYRRLHAWRQWLTASARGDPLLITIDDLPRLDPLVLAGLRAFPIDLAELPILWLVATTRGHHRRDITDALGSLAKTPGVRQISVPALTAEAVDEIVHDLEMPSAIPVAAQAGGAPALLLPLLTGLRDGAPAHAGTGLPDTVHAAVHRVIASAPTAAHWLFTDASVILEPFTVAEVADVLQRDPVSVIGAAADLLGCGVWVESGDTIRFAQEITRRVVASDLSPERFRQLSRRRVDVRLARGASPIDVADQLFDVANPGDAAAPGILQAAAVATSCMGDAVRWSRRALDLTPVTAAGWVARHADAVRLLWLSGERQAALDLADSGGVRGCRALQSIATLLAIESSFTDAIEVVDAIALSAEHDPARRFDLIVARMEAFAALTGSMSGVRPAPPRQPAVDDTVAGVYRTMRESVESVQALRWSAAVELAGTAIVLADTRSAAESHAVAETRPATLHRALLLGAIGQIDDATADLDRALRVPLGASPRLADAVQARLAYLAGDLSRAQTHADRVLASNRTGQYANLADMIALVTAGDCVVRARDVAAAARILQLAAGMAARETGPIRATAIWLLARLAAADGDTAAAAGYAWQVFRPGRGLEWPYWDPAELPMLVRLANAVGDDELARFAVDTATSLATRSPELRFLTAIATHAQGLAQRDPVLLLEASRLLQAHPRALVRANIIEDLADVTVDDDSACDLLRDSLHMMEAAGASADAARVSRRLRERGAVRTRLRHEVLHRRLTLTPAEERVVAMVAAGASNRETAAMLFLSPNTVASHLRRAFRKLGVRSRVELTRALASGDE